MSTCYVTVVLHDPYLHYSSIYDPPFYRKFIAAPPPSTIALPCLCCIAVSRVLLYCHRIDMASPPNALPVLPGAAAQQAQPQARRQAANCQGGYDCDFVQSPPEIIQSECPICHLVLREPYQAPCCGNSFCRTCIEPIRLGNANCPTCRHAGFTTFPDKRLERSLNPFKVFCSRRDEGCEWNGELGSLERHLNENPIPSERLAGCNFGKVNCTHCAQSFRRQSLDTHESTECRLRPYSCDHCGEFASSYEDVVSNHHPVCERYPLPCPNKCDEIPEGFKYAIERRNLEFHVNEECLQTVVQCDFHYAGCESRLPRKDMSIHLADCLVTHMSLMAVHGRKTATEAQRALAKRDEQIAQLRREQTEQRIVVNELERENRSLKEQLHSHLLTPPVTFTMTEFSQHKRNKDTWYSPPFYTHPHGYKMCVKVLCNEGHIFIGVPLMRGKFDNQLMWPFQKIVLIRILNQCSEENHIITTSDYSGDSRFERFAMRVTAGELHMKGRGEDILYAALDSWGDCERGYVKYDMIQLQVVDVVDTVPACRLERHILSTINHKSFCTPPHQFVMTEFEQHKESGHMWYSPSFYTHREGYRMCLRVNANGRATGKNTHLSLYTHLMRGEFDSLLKWPFRGTVNIQMMNQLEDREHRTESFSYTNKTPDLFGAGEADGERSHGWGSDIFFLHSELGLSVANNRQYLKDDNLVFRIISIKLK